MIRVRIAAAAVALALAAPAAQAQSVLSARGLGFPSEPLDARSRGLGGLTTGLRDPHMSLINPAEMVGLPSAGLSVTFQGDEVASLSPDRDQTFTTARFPAIQAAFPVGDRLVASLGYASVLDQNWSVSRLDTLELGGQRRQVVDLFRSQGGAARLRLGAGYRVLPRVDVGAAVDVFTGAVRDSAVRSIEGLNASLQGTDYTLGGVGLSAGARWRGDALSVSAAVSGGGELTAESDVAGVASKSYTLPLTLDVGASARVSQRLMAAVSARRIQWSAVDDELAAGTGGGTGAGYGAGARDALQLSGGIEYEGLRLLGRPLPVRLGGRYAELPFRWSPEAEFPDERAVTGGFGILFGGGAAALELGGERGWRGGDAAVIDESFWRVSLSLSLLGR